MRNTDNGILGNVPPKMQNARSGRNRRLTAFAVAVYIPRKALNMAEKRKFLGVHYQCCNVYARAYMNKEKTAYTGACPRCGKRVEMKIGRDGIDSRFFSAR